MNSSRTRASGLGAFRVLMKATKGHVQARTAVGVRTYLIRTKVRPLYVVSLSFSDPPFLIALSFFFSLRNGSADDGGF